MQWHRNTIHHGHKITPEPGADPFSLPTNTPFLPLPIAFQTPSPKGGIRWNLGDNLGHFRLFYLHMAGGQNIPGRMGHMILRPIPG
jgi:hypothetical protein